MITLSHTTCASVAGALMLAAAAGAIDGCAAHRMLTGAPPVAREAANGGENRYTLFEKRYEFTHNGKLTERIHSIERVGTQGTEHGISVFDGSITTLTGFETRVVHASGAVEWYGRGDLGSYSLSNARVIGPRSERYVMFKEVPGPGEIIEAAYEYDIALPQLGVMVWPPDADTVRCVVVVPDPDTLLWHTMNGLGPPSVLRHTGSTDYVFAFPSRPANRRRSAYAKQNGSPALLCIDPSVGPRTWAEFGDWYADVINAQMDPDDSIAATARRVTRAEMSDVQKMNALARYCQSAVRYEEVYVERGEFIPERAPVVYARKYGDCKGYSCLLISMARALGLDAHPALCYRGTGFQVCDTLPVTQFNHMIVNYRSGGKDYWYDGTNRGGEPGVTTDDIVNARALVVARGASHLATIPESEANLFSISGTLRRHGSALAGTLTVALASQYAVGFSYEREYLNQADMTSGLASWLLKGLSSHLRVRSLAWRSSGDAFQVDVGCDIPDAIISVDSSTYVRFDRVFDRLLPPETPGEFPGGTDYYPAYARVAAEITLPDFRPSAGAGPFTWKVRWAIPPGPFDKGSLPTFLARLGDARTSLGTSYSLSNINAP